MPFPQFDRSRLRLQPLANRKHDLALDILRPLDAERATFSHPHIPAIGQRLAEAKARGASRILMMGAHVLRAGCQLHLIDLMERGLVSLIAMNGAGPIHDWEFALVGASTESVARYVSSGEFGLWEETGKMNDAITRGVKDGMGLGESIGRAIAEGFFPHKHASVLAAAYRLKIPVTVHIGIGYDIIHEHPNADGGVLGRASYTDFLVFAEHVKKLEGGIVLNFGTAVMGPEVYLKALAMARNVAHQKDEKIAKFTTAVFDLLPLGEDYHAQAPKTDPRYYYRPWKTILVRTVADGGESFYVQGDHGDTLPAVWRAARWDNPMLTSELIGQILATIPNRTVGVLGDLFLDRYLDIDPALNEPSVETGLTAYQVTRVRGYPGAAGTVMNNLAALGVGRIYPITVIGDDGEGYELRQALRRLPAVEQGGIVIDPGRRTPTYCKPMLGKDELNRLDIKNRTPTPDGIQDHLIELLDEAWPQLDALLVLDQVSEEDCGVVTKLVRNHLAELASGDPAKFVLADSRERIELFGCVCVKPNSMEISEAFFRNAEREGEETFPNAPAIFQTSGAEGIWLHRLDSVAPLLVPAYPVSGPIDICGAGDSCSAGVCCAMVSGATHEQAAAFGNLVASITIQQIGVTGTATPEQVRARWREVRPSE